MKLLMDMCQAYIDARATMELPPECHGWPGTLYMEAILRCLKDRGWKSPEDHDRRVTELLDANNKELERRRALQVAVRNVLHHYDAGEIGFTQPVATSDIEFMRAKLIDCTGYKETKA